MVGSATLCVFKGCTNSKKKNPELSFHRFPENDVNLIGLWIKRCGNDTLKCLEPSQLCTRRICSAHFEESDFIKGRRVLLNAKAVPRDYRHETSKEQLPPNNLNVEEDATVLWLKKSVIKYKLLSKKYLKESISLRRVVSRLKCKKRKSTSKLIASNLSEFVRNKKTLDFLLMQINHVKQRKWTDNEKKMALSIYQRGPKCYKYLRNEMEVALPCVTLIQEWINEIQITTGFNPAFFSRLRDKVDLMNERERECVLMFDEIAIKQLLQYDIRYDLVHGFVDLGSVGRNNEIANSALVFMLRGLHSSWKQPIAFFFSHGPVKTPVLVDLINECFDNVFSVGLKIKFMVCDQAQTNCSTFAQLGISKTKLFVEHNDEKIYCGYDVPHLVKCLRNILLKGDIVSNKKTISWGPIRELYNLEINSSCKSAYKLTDRHLDPNHFERMKVKLAVQVFSKSVASGLNVGYINGELKHPSCKSTAEFIEKVNDLFDCLNARHTCDKNIYRKGLCDYNPSVEGVLKNSTQWLAELSLASGATAPRTFANFAQTVSSILELWDESRQNYKYLLTANLQQDPLENLFGHWRNSLGCNHNPTAKQLMSCAHHSMFVSVNKPPTGANCVDDVSYLLLGTNQSLVITDKHNKDSNVPSNKPNVNSVDGVNGTSTIVNELDLNASLDFETDLKELNLQISSVNLKSLEECSIRYVAGYVAHRYLTKFPCFPCMFLLVKENQKLETPNEALIASKAYMSRDGGQFGSLKAPSDELYSIISAGFKIFESSIKPLFHEPMPRKRFCAMLQQYTTNNYREWINQLCETHCQFLFDVFSRTLIFYNLKWWSAKLQGRKRLASKDSPNIKKLKIIRHE